MPAVALLVTCHELLLAVLQAAEAVRPAAEQTLGVCEGPGPPWLDGCCPVFGAMRVRC